MEKVFLFLCAGTLLDLLLADLVTPRSVSSSPIPATGDILVKMIIVTCSGNFQSHQPFTSIHYCFSNYKSLETILLTFALKINNHYEPFFMYTKTVILITKI